MGNGIAIPDSDPVSPQNQIQYLNQQIHILQAILQAACITRNCLARGSCASNQRRHSLKGRWRRDRHVDEGRRRKHSRRRFDCLPGEASIRLLRRCVLRGRRRQHSGRPLDPCPQINPNMSGQWRRGRVRCRR